MLPPFLCPGAPWGTVKTTGLVVETLVVFWGPCACILRPPLGVLRLEWVLGLWPLLAGVPEGLGAQDLPPTPHPPWGSVGRKTRGRSPCQWVSQQPVQPQTLSCRGQGHPLGSQGLPPTPPTSCQTDTLGLVYTAGGDLIQGLLATSC